MTRPPDPASWRWGEMSTLTPICFTCTRFLGIGPRGWYCDAYEAIPVDVLSTTVDHRQPFEGDHGLQYVAKVEPEVPVESRHDASPDIFRRDALEEQQPVLAAGVMHVTDDGRVLMMRRVDSGFWAFPGGHVEEGETARQAAARETREETGIEVDEEDLVPWTHRVADGVDFTTFVHRCGEPFEPVLNDEHDEHSWEQWGDYSGDSLARVAGGPRSVGDDEGYSATADALPPSHGAALARGARSDAWEESKHPRGPGGQFVAKLKAEFPWLGDAEPFLTGSGTKVFTPNGGTLYLGATDKTWSLAYSGSPVASGSTTDNTLQHTLSILDEKWGEADLTTPAKKSESKPAVSPAIKLSDLKQVGPKLGSNEGGTYEAADGTRYYVKLPQSDDHAKNELLAASLYRLAGGSVLDYHPVEGEKLGDAVGMSGDNVGVVAGKPVNLDLGGSLLYRAQGSPKGDKFDDKATEWKTLRQASVNPKAAQLFSGMTPDQLMTSASFLKTIDSKDILDLVTKHGPGDEATKAALAVRLIKRRDAVVAQAYAESQESTKPKPSKPAAPPKPEKYGKHADTTEGAHHLREELAATMPSRSGKESAAIGEYKGSGYYRMNDCMRFLDDCDDAQVLAMQKYIDKCRLPAMTVYRGIKGEIAKRVAPLLKIGRKFRDEGFVSTSISESFSQGWAGGKHGDGILMEIRVPEGSLGTTANAAGHSDSEYEVILQRNSKFHIESYDPATRRVVATLDHSHHVGEVEQQQKEAA